MNSNDLQALLARVVHDLKAPMRQMGNMVQLLACDSDFNEEQQKLVHMLTNIADKGQYQLDGLSFFAHSIGCDQEKSQVELAEVMICIAEEFSELELVGLEQARFQLDINVQALKTMLREVFSNALKFAPCNAQPQLVFSVDKLAFTRLSFRSKSVGVACEDLTKLLQPYTRDENANNIAGYGMGLAVVAFLAEQSGGAVSLSCDQNNGFSVHLDMLDQGLCNISEAA